MRNAIITALVALLAMPAFAAEAPKTEDQKTLYTVGQIMAQSLNVLSLTPDEFEFVKQGIVDSVMRQKPQVNLNAYKQKAQDMAAARRDARGEKLLALAKDYTEKAAKEQGAVTTATGVIYQSLLEGKGDSPTESDKVKVNYTGTLVDGTLLDSTEERGKPSEFPLAGTMKCWVEGIKMMKPGGKAKLVCPPNTALGTKPSGTTPGNATLLFDVELLEVIKK